jgi:hypothetical protein
MWNKFTVLMVTGLVLIQNIMFVLLGILIGSHQMATTTMVFSSHTATVTITDHTELNSTDKVNLIATDETNYDFTNGDQSSVAGTWESTTSNAQTATNLMNVINTSSGPAGTRFSATVDGAVVSITQNTVGKNGNTTVTLTDTGTAGMTKTNFTGGSVTRNNGATIISGGNVDGTAVTNSKALMDNLDSGPSYGSKVVAITGTKHKPGVQTSKGSGALAYQPSANDPQFLLRGYSSKINNVASTALQIPGADSGGRANKAGVVKTHRYDISSIAYTTGFATKGGNAGDASSFVQSDGSTAATDDALQTTRAIPGELVFHIGANSPTQADYSAKTGG